MSETYSEYPFPPSLWEATAKPALPTPPLELDRDTDVVIIGAGFTGLSTALHLAERGVGVCVLEAEEPGWGASGRNGGQVIPGLKYDPDELEARFGSRAEGIVQMASGAADVVFDLIEKYRVDCNAVRKGWIQTAHSPKVLQAVEKRARQWEKRGVRVELLDRAAVCERTGSRQFVGGWVDYRAGSVQPLSYARGLLRVARELGVAVHGKSPAVRMDKEGAKWRVAVGTGASVTAEHVVICTNGYTDDLWPKLRQTILPANSFLVATKPLPDELGGAILKGNEVTSDSRRLLVYFRRDEQGRLVLGGRGPIHEPKLISEWQHIERALHLLFPHLKNVEFDYRWAGRIAMTADFLPHVHEPAAGVHILLGYNGRGVALGTAMGMCLAAHIAGDRHAAFPYPITGIKPIPFHNLRWLYMSAGVAWYRLLDALS